MGQAHVSVGSNWEELSEQISSGLPLKAEITQYSRHVSNVPGAETFTALRKAAARSAETICVTIGEILRALTPTECANYFRNSGYAQS